MPSIRVIDVETLFEEPQPGGICEVGYTDVIATNTDLLGAPIDWVVGEPWSTLIDPRQPIPANTSAVHHIIDKDVQGKPSWAETWPKIFDGTAAAYGAHGAKFERAWIGPDMTGAAPWIDTYRCALWAYPESPTFSNSGLRYHLRPEGLVREKADPAHRAGPDSYVTAFHIRDLLNAGRSIEQLVKWTDEPAPVPRCMIGDYRNGGKGTPWMDVEASMLRWILSKDFGEDVVFTVRREIERRAVDERLAREQHELNRQFLQNGIAPDPMPANELPPVSAYENQRSFL